MDALKAYESDTEDSVSAAVEDDVNQSLDTATGETHDFFGIRSEKITKTDGSVKKKKVGEEFVDTENDRSDLFGIFSEETCESRKHGSSHRLQHEDVVKKSLNFDYKEVTVEIPSSSFWSVLPVEEIQDNQQIANLSQNKQQHSLYKNHIRKKDQVVGQKRTTESYGDQRLTKRKKVPIGYDSSVSKGEQQSGKSDISEKRKLYFVHSKITPLLHGKRINCKIPTAIEWDDPGHAGAINRLKWNIPNYSHLLVTCSMDTTIKIWNIWSQLDPCVHVLRAHTKAVRDVAWNQDGRHLLSGSYDKSAVVSDVERGATLSRLEHTSFVTCCKYHPVNPQVCVTGSSNQLQIWDTRTPSEPCRVLTYKDSIGQVHDIVLTGDGSTVFSCSDLVSRDSADRNLMAWDFRSGIVLSNQIYQERYTLARLQIHPTENQLLAQSNGNYIALFSLQRPYKMNKHKRFEGHKMQGFNTGFDISPDGQTVYSGSADGKFYCYNYQSGKLVQSVSTGLQVIMEVACHPLLHSTVAVSSWDGTVQVWK